MKLLIAMLLPLAASATEPDLAKIPWPKLVCEFPEGEKVSFTSRGYEVSLRVPSDPKIQSSGGSGGPMVEITLHDMKRHWSTSFTEQSVGERLLEDYRGKPQIEIWARVGGGSWVRGLHRYISGQYRCVRIDEFAQHPNQRKRNEPTAKLPSDFKGRAYPVGDDTLYFIETRLPKT